MRRNDWQESFDFGGEQEENLARVSSRIGLAIINFCRTHKIFYAEELRAAVTRATGIAAPASADRVLRALRQQGVISYVVVSRRESKYEVTAIRGAVNGNAS
jgi:hypothetical protein